MKDINVEAKVDLDDVLDNCDIEDVVTYYGPEALAEALNELEHGPEAMIDELGIPGLLRGLADKFEEHIKEMKKVKSSGNVNLKLDIPNE